MTFFQGCIWFIVAIGPLVVFHELGHYLVARLCGVKVLRFSVGMGKVVWSRRFGKDQTEWALSMLPIGGYVKMLDDRDPETAAKNADDARREFTRQSVWRRIAIVAAGPLANFILAIVVLTGLYMYGVKDLPPLVRAMPEQSALYQAGVRGGDRILAVNGVKVPAWSELRWAVLDALLAKSELRLELGQTDGAVSNVTVPQAAIAAINLEADPLGQLGLTPFLPPAVADEVGEGPAKQAGMQSGDMIVAVNGKPVRDVIEVVQAVHGSEGRMIPVRVARGEQQLVLSVTPVYDAAVKRFRMNVSMIDAEQITVPLGPVSALVKGVRFTWDRSVMQLKMLGKIATLQLSPKNISGPFTIGDVAAKAAKVGVIEFLSFVAVVSISLGVMNLLPIPMLDGGHLLYYSLEVLTRRPLPEQFVEYAQRAGVVMLVMLMSLALFNDAVRLL